MQRLFFTLLLVPSLAAAQVPLSELRRASDSLAARGLADHEVPALGLILMRGDSVYQATYGLANVEKGIAADTLTLFQLGSVGKIFTAIAVLQQVEAGNLKLDDDVNTYLEGFKTTPPGRPITLTDLLTHTAGLDERVIGYLARSEQEVKPLVEHLRDYLPRSFQPPGVSINYSNYSYALAGHLVERASGMNFTEYVGKRILEPLGMTHTTYRLPDNYGDLAQYAAGYRTRDTFEPVTCFPRHATPAGSALSCVTDMAKLLAELRRPTGKVLSDSSMQLLKTRRFTNHPALMGYTLVFEEQHIGGQSGIGKGGAFTGFIAELAIFPEADFAMYFTTNTQTDNFMEDFNRELLKRALPPAPPATTPSAMAMNVDEFAGVFRSERASHHTVEEIIALYQGKMDLSVSEEGDLVTYQNGAWQHYRPVDSLLFQNTAVPGQYLAFERDASGRVARLFTNINLAGFYVPVSLTRVPWYDNPVMINEYYFIILVVILTFIFVPFYRIWILIRRRRDPAYNANVLVPNGYVYMALAVLVLYVFHFFGGFIYLARHVNDFYFGVPDTFRQTQQMTWLLPFVVAGLVVATIRLWVRKPGRTAFRIYYLLICLCAIIHLLFLYRWHFIGLNV